MHESKGTLVAKLLAVGESTVVRPGDVIEETCPKLLRREAHTCTRVQLRGANDASFDPRGPRVAVYGCGYAGVRGYGVVEEQLTKGRVPRGLRIVSVDEFGYKWL